MMEERIFLYNDLVDTKVQFVSFIGNSTRHDLAIMKTDRFFGKVVVLNMQGNQYAIIGHDDLDEEHYLEEVFSLNEDEGEELREFLREVI